MRTIILYLVLLGIDMKARTQYRADFLIGIAASALQHVATLAVLWLVFGQVPALGGWTQYQAAVLYALFSLAFGLTNLLGGGLRDLPWLVHQGELDGLLVLPASPYAQLLPRFNPGALGDLAVSTAVLAGAAGPAGVRWTPLTAAFGLLAVLAGTAILLGLLTAAYSIVFWVRQPGVTNGLEELTQLARYPAGVYPRWVKLVITWVFPVAFASYYPAAVLTGAEGFPPWLGLMVVPAAAAGLLAGAWTWHRGLSRYEGTGS